MKKVTRRNFLKQSLRTGGALLASTLVTGSSGLLADNGGTFTLNVGYLSIADHLILPVSHALDNKKYYGFRVKPFLCKSWDEIIAKIDMGLLHAAFLPAPLAMHKVNLGSSLRCVLTGHINGSVIVAEKSITGPAELAKKIIAVPHIRSTQRVLLYKYFKDKGIENVDDVKLLEVPPPLVNDKLKRGVIDAFSVAEPWGMQSTETGISRVIEYSANIIPNHVCCLVMLKKKIIERKARIARLWIESLVNAGKYIHVNPKRAASIQREYMGHEPAEIVRLIEGGRISYLELKPTVQKLAIIHDPAFQCGVLSQKCNLQDFVCDKVK